MDFIFSSLPFFARLGILDALQYFVGAMLFLVFVGVFIKMFWGR